MDYICITFQWKSNVKSSTVREYTSVYVMWNTLTDENIEINK